MDTRKVTPESIIPKNVLKLQQIPPPFNIVTAKKDVKFIEIIYNTFHVFSYGIGTNSVLIYKEQLFRGILRNSSYASHIVQSF